MHLFFTQMSETALYIPTIDLCVCDIYEGDQSNLYRKCVVIVLNTRGFMSKMRPNLLYNVDISVRFYIAFLRVLGDFALKDVPPNKFAVTHLV